MRSLKPYISIEYLGKNDDGKRLFKVYACVKVPDRGTYEIESNTLIRIGIQTRPGLGNRSIRCTQLGVVFKEGTNNPGKHDFASTVFEQDQEDGMDINHIWVKLIGHPGFTPDEGAIGNYEDPD